MVKNKNSNNIIDPAIIEDDQPILPPNFPAREFMYPEKPDTDTSSNYLVPTKIKEKREKTRGTLAMIFIVGFFIILILGGFMVALANDKLDNKAKNLQDVFIAISGILSGPLGFVVGYYFRRQEEIEN